MGGPHWREVHKGDVRCRLLADGHYSRQTPGHPMFTRPGYNLVLYAIGPKGGAVYVWWRPKWEDGRKGTSRMDGLRAIECTIFRNVSGLLSSELIREAVDLLPTWEHAQDTDWPDGAITGVNSDKTRKGRSKRSQPGECFLRAGWRPFLHRATRRADIWLRAPLSRDRKEP